MSKNKNQIEHNYLSEQRSKSSFTNGDLLEAREKVSGQVGTGISFVFDYLDWLR